MRGLEVSNMLDIMQVSRLLLLFIVLLFLYICVLAISDKPLGLIHDNQLGSVIIFSVLLLIIVRHLQLGRLSGKV